LKPRRSPGSGGVDWNWKSRRLARLERERAGARLPQHLADVAVRPVHQCRPKRRGRKHGAQAGGGGDGQRQQLLRPREVARPDGGDAGF